MMKPAIDFAPVDVEDLESATKKLVEEYLGRTLAAADPIYLLIKSFLAIIIQQRRLLDYAAKQNLLAYATGNYLDALGQLVGVTRHEESKAKTTLEVELSTVRSQVTTIAKGTRVTADNQIFFATDEQLIFLSGETVKTVSATCLTAGEVGNGFDVGELNRIVDPQPFLKSIVNTTTTDGGSDVEGDDSLRERIHIAPESFSCAGSKGAYIARVKEVSALITDVAITSPQPGKVDVYLLTANGLPSTQLINDVADYLNQKEIRPLTDLVTVKAPTKTTYSIAVKCLISDDDRGQAAQIIQDAESAVEEFITWQASKLGRDLNPSKLLGLLMAAGVKRCEITQPTFQVLDEVSIAICADKSLTFDYEAD